MSVIASSPSVMLAGCAPNAPVFKAPIVWKYKTPPGYEGPVPALVALSDGTAILRDFPHSLSQSSTAPASAPSDCWSEGMPLYSGAATWESLDNVSIEVSYDGAHVTLNEIGGKFGSDDWTMVWLQDCSGAQDTLGMVCGNSDGGTSTPLPPWDTPCTDDQLRLTQ